MPLAHRGSRQPAWQGLSIVVFLADEGQGFVGMSGVSAEGGGFVLDGVAIQEVEGEVAQGGEDDGG